MRSILLIAAATLLLIGANECFPCTVTAKQKRECQASCATGGQEHYFDQDCKCVCFSTGGGGPTDPMSPKAPD